MSNSPHVSNNICVSLATIELSGTITYVKIWDIAREAVGAEGTSIALHCSSEDLCFPSGQLQASRSPSFLPPCRLFRPAVCGLCCTRSTPSPLHHPKHVRTCGKQNPAQQAHHKLDLKQNPWPAGRTPTLRTTLSPKRHQFGMEPLYWGFRHIFLWHQGCPDNLLGSSRVPVGCLSRSPPLGCASSGHSCRTHT